MFLLAFSLRVTFWQGRSIPLGFTFNVLLRIPNGGKMQWQYQLIQLLIKMGPPAHRSVYLITFSKCDNSQRWVSKVIIEAWQTCSR